MILPDKHVALGRSLLGVGAVLLARLDRPRSVSALWELCRADPLVGSYESFVLGLDLLFAAGAIKFRGARLMRSQV